MCDQTDEPFNDTQFPSHDDVANTCRFAATICLSLFRPDRLFVPEPGEPTGTVTFLEIAGETYALTAGHVIRALDDRAKLLGRDAGAYFLPKDPGYQLLGPFLVPPKDLAARLPPDVALCPISPGLPVALGKKAFVVTEGNCAPETITHGHAVGFPTGAKAETTENGRIRVEMPCVHAIAEFSSASVDQLNFYSPLSSFPKNESLSGMSGGPVFWSTESEYGLAGIVIESIDAGPDEPLYNEPMVHFVAQRVDYQTLLDWASDTDARWPAARALKNEQAIAKQQAEPRTALGVQPPQ